MRPQAKTCTASSPTRRSRGRTPPGAPLPAADRWRVRTEVARQFFLAAHGREPIDDRELAGQIAKDSRPRTQTVAGYDLRLRALLRALPAFLNGYAAGRAALNLPNVTPSYSMSARSRAFAEHILTHLDAAARELAGADCGHENRQSSRFCGRCGVSLVGGGTAQAVEPRLSDERSIIPRAIPSGDSPINNGARQPSEGAHGEAQPSRTT
jgi:hypothetical protein